MYVCMYLCIYVCMYVQYTLFMEDLKFMYVCMYADLPATPRSSPRLSTGVKNDNENAYMHAAIQSSLPANNDSSDLSATLDSQQQGSTHTCT